MPVRITRVKETNPVTFEETVDGFKVWKKGTYIGRIVLVKPTGHWMAYPPSHLAECFETRDKAVLYLAMRAG